MGELEVTAIASQLKKLLKNKHGAYAAALYLYARDLVDVLCPANNNPGLNDGQRVIKVEQLIRDACAALDGPTGEALKVLCAFAPGTYGTSLERRREEMGKILNPTYGIQADTVRRPHIWNELIFGLAFELCKLAVYPGAPADNRNSNPMP